MAPDPAPRGHRPARDRAGTLLTGRGALLGMFALFFLGTLASAWLHWGPLAGGSFLIGCAAAAWRTKPSDLLAVTVSPPLLFFCALIFVKALTATGNTVVFVAEGSALTLANTAPWLFAGVALVLIIACARGLPGCVRELRRELRPDLPRTPPASRPGGGLAGSPRNGAGRSR